jgi:hypothetical protein
MRERRDNNASTSEFAVYDDGNATLSGTRERQMRIYENVTRGIIEEMERGAVPWVRP